MSKSNIENLICIEYNGINYIRQKDISDMLIRFAETIPDPGARTVIGELARNLATAVAASSAHNESLEAEIRSLNEKIEYLETDRARRYR